MNFHFPDQRALCLAENATHNLHNLLTLRGAAGPRRRGSGRATSPRRSSCSPTTPTSRSPRTTGRPGARTTSSRCMTEQRDLYAYLHDQTLRLMNQGYVGSEIAEMLADAAGARRRVAHPRLLRLGQPQRQGDLPALPRLVRRQPGPPVAAPARGRRPPATSRPSAASTRPSRKAQEFADAGDLRFAAELASHAVFADPDHDAAQGRCSPTSSPASATAPRAAPGATST